MNNEVLILSWNCILFFMILSWSRNGRKLLSGSNDWNVSVWDVLSGECDQKYRFQSHVTKVQFHPRNKYEIYLQYLSPDWKFRTK